MMSKMTTKKIEKAIYPCGFFRNKAKTIREISKKIVEDYAGEVPDSIAELVEFKGVGRKTANLVLTLGFDKPAICVDIHVHRIFNRLGYVKTKNPDETEMKLREKLPLKLWKRINSLLVFYGQNTQIEYCNPLLLDLNMNIRIDLLINPFVLYEFLHLLVHLTNLVLSKILTYLQPLICAPASLFL